MKKIYIFLFAIILLLPLGLLSENPAWGEWDINYFEKKLGFIPKGIQNSSSINALFADYQVKGLGDVSSYYISGIVGVLVIFLFFYLLKKAKIER